MPSIGEIKKKKVFVRRSTKLSHVLLIIEIVDRFSPPDVSVPLSSCFITEQIYQISVFLLLFDWLLI